MLDDILLDQVRSDDIYNFVSQYESHNQVDDDDAESSLWSCNIANEYYEPGELCGNMNALSWRRFERRRGVIRRKKKKI